MQIWEYEFTFIFFGKVLIYAFRVHAHVCVCVILKTMRSTVYHQNGLWQLMHLGTYARLHIACTSEWKGAQQAKQGA